MYTDKLHPGSPFPDISASLLDGRIISLTGLAEGTDWKLVLVYRGRHCPLCTRYLNQLQEYIPALSKIGVDVIAVSGDTREQLQQHMSKLNITFPIAHGLTEAQMKALGLFISVPRSEQETDHNFAEPGLFVINEQGTVQVVDISNNPFVRPELDKLVSGLGWIRDPDNHYPIRGTFN